MFRIFFLFYHLLPDFCFVVFFYILQLLPARCKLRSSPLLILDILASPSTSREPLSFATRLSLLSTSAALLSFPDPSAFGRPGRPVTSRPRSRVSKLRRAMSVYFMRGIMSGEGNRSIIPAVEKDRTRLYHSTTRRLRFLIAITLQICCANILQRACC